jgi:hypothetical protein
MGLKRKNMPSKKIEEPFICAKVGCTRFGIQVFGKAKKEFCSGCGGLLLTVHTRDMNGKATNGIVHEISRTNDTFSCPPDLTGCPIAKKSRVYFPYDLYTRCVFLANNVSTEWIAYLLGFEREGGQDEVEITGMYFPKQSASKEACEAEEGEIQEGTIAAIHSHVGLEVYFSEVDQRHFNHKIEMVVNNKGSIIANGRIKLECGRYHRGPATIVFTGCSDNLAAVAILKGNLQVKPPVFETATRVRQASLIE